MMEYSALDFYKDGSVILCFDIRKIIVNTKLSSFIRSEINDFIYLAFSDNLISYETIFCTTGRHSFDFLNGWKFMDLDSAHASQMTCDDYGIWWDVEGLKEFVEELESK